MIAIVITMVAAIVWLFQQRRHLKKELKNIKESEELLRREFGPIIDKTQHLSRLTHEVADLEQQLQLGKEIAQKRQVLQELGATAVRAEAEWKQLIAARTTQLADLDQQVKQTETRLAVIQERENILDAGFYELHYDFDSSQTYIQALDEVRMKQKGMIKDQTAAICKARWTIDGDQRAGQKMTRDYLKLMLRAFNGECDAAVLKVKYNNIDMLEKRLETTWETLNKLGTVNQCLITEEFKKLKLAELRLTHEFQEKKHQEQDEQRAIREQMREEERAQRELEQAQYEAEKEERRYQAALEKARAELEAKSDKNKAALEQKIAELSLKLQTAQNDKAQVEERRKLAASGHVYVISNLGSFGEDVFKIGMTRRLDPQDRVDELGDASVPFPFDVHAMIYTSNAPELERKMHDYFRDKRMNRVNERKEFFRVTVDELESAVRRFAASQGHSEIKFTRTAVAEEYRKSIVQLSDQTATAQPSKLLTSQA